METTLTTSPPTSSSLMVSISSDTPSLSPSKSPSIDTGQMRSSSPFTPNSFPIHKSSLMSSSPPAAATAGSPIPNETRLSPSKESATGDQPPISASIRDADSVSSSLSDVETFNGKIVYNPDGSAYIIEGPDSDGSEVEAEISQEGSIIDARGLSPNYGSISFPQIVSAFHISRSSTADYYSTLCGSNLSQNSSNDSKVTEVPVMHSFRVFSLRNLKDSSSDQKIENGLDNFDDEEESKLRAANCSTVPVKPILMCFICKLSFGYTKSFVAHAVGEHHLTLNDDESRVLSSKNTSAIIQGVGKEKEPLLSFLKPKSSPAPFCTPSQAQQQLDAQRLLAVQMAAVASAFRSSSMSSNSGSASVPLVSDKLLSSDHVHSLSSPIPANSADDCAAPHSELSPVKGESGECNEFKIENEDSMSQGDEQTAKQSPSDTAAQFASELADLANLEKFAKAAAAAAQQQQMDLHSIAAAMAAAVAASNSGQNRTPSPGNKNGSPKNPVCSSQVLLQNQVPSVSNANTSFTPAAAAAVNILNSDCKSLSLFPNSSDSETASLLSTVANHVPRTTLTSTHPPLLMQHSRNSCKTLKCPKCNWHYKYQETLEIHMKEKHPENEMNCIYCLTNQPHPRLARGETYTCGYKPYRCDVCNYSTTTKGNLSIHMQSDKHINNVQELQNGNIPATAEHLLQSQALAAAVAQASAAASNGNSGSQNSTSNVPTSTTGNLVSSNSGSPVPTSTAVNLAAIAAAAAQQDAKNQLQKMSQQVNSSSTTTTMTTPSSTPNSSGSKQKATWRCDVCNYETNVARNLRIHMTSEKHTHNIMVLKQNVTQMQQLNAIQQGIISPEQLLQFNPGLFAAAAAAAGINSTGQSNNNDNGGAIQPEVALADIAYNHALLMMASQQQQRTMAAIMQQQQANNTEPKSPVNSVMLSQNGTQPTFDMEHPDLSLSNPAPYDDSCRVYHCCVCSTFTSDSIETLSQHIQCDRTRTREDEVLMSVGGSYICKLCSYKTNLKANFQLHCKTDKHLQRLQHVNHIKEGGPQAEWKLKFINVSNPVQVRCNVCDYYTNSIHKLQLHSANPRHDICTRIFTHLQMADLNTNTTTTKYYYCSLCSSATRTKIALIQHLKSVKHVRNESLRQLKHQQTGSVGMKDSEEEIRDMFHVKELCPSDKITFDGKCRSLIILSLPDTISQSLVAFCCLSIHLICFSKSQSILLLK